MATAGNRVCARTDPHPSRRPRRTTGRTEALAVRGVRRARPRVAVVAVVALVALVAGAAGCGDSRRERTVETVEPPPRATEEPPARPSEPAPPAYTPNERRLYHRHLSEGRTLARDRRYGEAIAAFEAALRVIPMDARALSEVGWAAFQAGDYDRAYDANEASLRAAIEPEVQAASLYNLGRIAEARGEREQAAAHYRRSLALRPSDTVEARLTALAEPVPRPGEPAHRDLPCTAPMPHEALCDCLLAARSAPAGGGEPAGAKSAGRVGSADRGDPSADKAPRTPARPSQDVTQDATEAASGGAGSAEADGDASCVLEPRDVPGVELAIAGDDEAETIYLAARSAAGWAVIAEIGAVQHPSEGRFHEETELAAMRIEAIGSRRVLWVEAETQRRAVSADAVESRSVRGLTVCVVPDDGEAWRCPLAVPLVEAYSREPVETAGRSTAARRKPGDARSQTRRRRLAVEVGEDGVARVVLAEGERDEAIARLLGPRSLW